MVELSKTRHLEGLHVARLGHLDTEQRCPTSTVIVNWSLKFIWLPCTWKSIWDKTCPNSLFFSAPIVLASHSGTRLPSHCSNNTFQSCSLLQVEQCLSSIIFHIILRTAQVDFSQRFRASPCLTSQVLNQISKLICTFGVDLPFLNDKAGPLLTLVFWARR